MPRNDHVSPLRTPRTGPLAVSITPGGGGAGGTAVTGCGRELPHPAPLASTIATTPRGSVDQDSRVFIGRTNAFVHRLIAAGPGDPLASARLHVTSRGRNKRLGSLDARRLHGHPRARRAHARCAGRERECRGPRVS